jgi:hypothetical protein
MDDLDDWFYNLLAVLSRLIAAELHPVQPAAVSNVIDFQYRGIGKDTDYCRAFFKKVDGINQRQRLFS